MSERLGSASYFSGTPGYVNKWSQILVPALRALFICCLPCAAWRWGFVLSYYILFCHVWLLSLGIFFFSKERGEEMELIRRCEKVESNWEE